MNAKFRYASVLILTLGILYFACLPSTVQMGDTGELVRSAYALQVPHPPGYPLFTFLNAAAVRVIPYETVFWRASAFTAVCAIVACALLLLMFTENALLGLLFVLTFATSRLFWRFSVLPDVFAFHALIVAGLLLIYLSPRFKKFEIYLPMLFLMGLSHHLTLIFLLPVITHSAFKHRRETKMWVAAGIGFAFVVSAYASLSFLNPADLDSWGLLTSIKATLSHFLRSDYGTFKLVGTNDKGSILELLTHLVQQTFQSFSLLILVSIPLIYLRSLKNKIFPLKECFVAASIFLYVAVFFYLSNTTLEGFRKETFERFFIFLYVLVCFWLCNYFINWKASRKNYWLVVFVLTVGVLYNITSFYRLNNFSKNTIIEDYAINFLNQAREEKRSAILAMTDTRFGALKYAQTVLDVQTNVLVVHPRLLFFKWYLEKISSHGLVLDSEQILKTNQLVVEQDLIIKNLNNFSFFTHLNFIDSTKYKIEITPLGRKLETGSGIVFRPIDNVLKFRSGPADIFEKESDYSVYYDLWSEYGNYSYYLGLARSTIDPPTALTNLRQVVAKVPWHFAAHKKICELENLASRNCDDEQKKLREVYFDYF